MKSKKNTALGFILLLALSLICPADAQEVRTNSSPRHSLWKIAGTNNAVYLLGSVHVLKEDNYPLPAPIETAYSNAQIVVFEADVAKMEDPEVQMKVMTKAQLPDGETLEQQLSAETYAKFKEHATKLGLPVEMFATMRPSLAAIMLTVIELQKLGFDPSHGLDKHFFDRAQKAGKKIVPLETVDFQIDLITGFTKEEGELLMKTTLKDIDNIKKVYGDIVKAWQSGDSKALEDLLNEAMREAPIIFKRLLTDRNQRWVPKIQELLRGDKNAIVIVGAGHLVGSEGVVELLKKKGLKVTQL